MGFLYPSSGVETPSWKTGAVTGLRADGYSQVKPWAAGGGAEASVYVQYPLFAFSNNTEKLGMYKSWLVENGYFERVTALSPISKAAENVANSFEMAVKTVSPGSTHATITMFGIVLLAGAAWFLWSKR